VLELGGDRYVGTFIHVDVFSIEIAFLYTIIVDFDR